MAPTDGTVLTVEHSFKIKAIAEGGATVSKDITARIIVCGWEALTLVDPATLTDSLVVRDGTTLSYTLVDLFSSNDTFCPPNAFAVKTSDADPSSATDPTAL